MQSTTSPFDLEKIRTEYEQLEDFGNQPIGFYFIEKFIAATENFKDPSIEDGISLMFEC